MRFFAIVLVVALTALAWDQNQPKPGVVQPEYKIKKDGLKPVLVQLGFKPKELGNGVLEIQIPKDDDTVFVAVSLSSSLSKIWLTGSFGALTDREMKDPEFLLSLLEKNGEIQPTHFYVRKGKLSIGVPVDNRVATAQILKKEIDIFSDNVIKTKEFWQRHD